MQKITSQADAWKDFRDTVLAPHNLDEDLLWLMETVFFSGGKSMHHLMLVATEPDNDDECERNLIALGEELDAFYDKMKERNKDVLLRALQEAANGLQD